MEVLVIIFRMEDFSRELADRDILFESLIEKESIRFCYLFFFKISEGAQL